MWLLGGKKSKKSSVPSNLPPGVDPSLFEDPVSDDEQIAEMNKQADVLVRQAKAMDIANIDDMTLSEEDHNDPDLIQALIDAGHEPTPHELEVLQKARGGRSKSTAGPATITPEAPRKQTTPPKRESPQQTIDQQIMELKKKALEYKTAGKTQEAIAALKEAKALEAMKSLNSAPSAVVVPTPVPNKPDQVIKVAAPAPVKAEKKQDDESVILARKYIEDLKAKGSAALKVGDKEAAKACIAKKKDIEAAVENHIKKGTPIDFKLLEDDIVVNQPESKKSPSGTFDIILTQLKKQSDFCKSNQEKATAASNLPLAKYFEKESQNQLLLHASVSSMRDRGEAPPKIQYIQQHFEVPDIHYDVGESELVLTIVKCMNVPSRGSSYPDTYVSYEFTSIATEIPQSGATSFASRDLNPVYQSSHKLKIVRNPRFAAAVKTKKLLKVRIHEKKMYGISSQVFGEGEVKMDELANKSEMETVVDISEPDRPRKLTGMKLVVNLRLRYPLEKTAQNVRISQDWLILGEGAPVVSAPAPQVILVPVEAQQKAAQPTSSTSSGQPTSGRSARGPPSSGKSAAPDYGFMFDEEHEDIETICSFKCLEWEVQYLMDNLPNTKGNTAKLFRNRVQQAQERMKTIEQDIECGITTPESYLDDLDELAKTMRSAVKQILAKEGKQDKRLPRMMKRIKIVEQELSDCRAAAEAADA
eukprot:TRINITY_DN8169_c0_g1_i2.p1 TRINITY_DN8169_c0_g1~~TRINITY_DN8169_c0_g1_i2.p1  ORF type:complete len:701 (+),score=182.84 TRINITY_DN8169_c0_g1_i2:76-2178(+)